MGARLVVGGPPDEPETGSELGATMRRRNKPEGVVCQVLSHRTRIWASLQVPYLSLSPGPVSEPHPGPRI